MIIASEKLENFEYLTSTQQQYLDEITIPRQLNLYATHPLDDEFVETNKPSWIINWGGERLSFHFNKSKSFNRFLKWIIGKFLRSYAPRYTYFLYDYLININLAVNIKDYIAELKVLSAGNNNSRFYVFKRYCAMLCEVEFPGFNLEDISRFDHIYHDRTDHWQVYYDVSLKFKPDIVRFIKNGLAHDFAQMMLLTDEELLEAALLGVCFETGIRPIQLYRLQWDDLVLHDDKFFSLKVQVVKQSKSSQQNRPVSVLTLSNETGKLLFNLKKRQVINPKNTQLFRNVDGSILQKKNYHRMINNCLRRYASPEQREHIPTLTIYDFRHNVGHSLAMSGASAEEIAYVLGHTSIVAAGHYIAATPEIARLKQRALGENSAYLEMMGMIMTGDIAEESTWRGKKVAGVVNGNLFMGIGGCAAQHCDFMPVRSCYGCSNYHPFADGHHSTVRKALQNEISDLINISGEVGQSTKNPLIMEHEGTLFEVDSVMRRCELYREVK